MGSILAIDQKECETSPPLLGGVSRESKNTHNPELIHITVYQEVKRDHKILVEGADWLTKDMPHQHPIEGKDHQLLSSIKKKETIKPADTLFSTYFTNSS